MIFLIFLIFWSFRKNHDIFEPCKIVMYKNDVVGSAINYQIWIIIIIIINTSRRIGLAQKKRHQIAGPALVRGKRGTCPRPPRFGGAPRLGLDINFNTFTVLGCVYFVFLSVSIFSFTTRVTDLQIMPRDGVSHLIAHSRCTFMQPFHIYRYLFIAFNFLACNYA